MHQHIIRTKTYQKNAMADSVCLICGEHPGEQTFRGKSVCPECLEFIRKNC